MKIICAATLMLNLTQFSWNKQDKQALTTAEKRCSELYKKSPCVKKFTKVEPGIYRIICGKALKIEDKKYEPRP
jgi:hypothetical protein